MAVNGLAADIRSLESIRTSAKDDPRAAVQAAAKQFEALFMQELLKSMRATTQGEGLMGGGASEELATGMLDQQYATSLTGMPGGLAEALTRQLERSMGLTPGPIPVTIDRRANPMPAPIGAAAERAPRIPEMGAAAFVQQHTRSAQAAEAATGIPAAFMVAQAAHESGWGRREILHADGSPSHNLFGIKAGAGWNGPVAEITTTEYIGGVARKVTAKFRAYASYAESFADYAKLMSNSPRYAAVTQADTPREFAQGLQRAGYATDPAYADKLTAVINTTLRLQRTNG
ncbi:flagellar assembly peptidoglycan hydrolase FlgJ [Rubrivivax albus]|uniref:Peptidoglycan hydrolase FlgJ n=1 Tax=Rubrivivax albus TaxID=2499835 RepID=A0A437K255_9BURK|nr:flagellar assembly peptidoglycan hydrolase FlgJ [Rubrivivax albus]RVT54343.1 flagellar assembly peptidoglycan hydrolase FlgJ [Rubrivivax albus]